MWEYRVTFTDGHVGEWHRHDAEFILEVIKARHEQASKIDAIYTIEIRPVS